MPGVVKTAPNVLITGTPVRPRAVPAAPLPASDCVAAQGTGKTTLSAEIARRSAAAAAPPALLPTGLRGSRACVARHSTGLEHINVSEMVKAQGLHWCACRSAPPTAPSLPADESLRALLGRSGRDAGRGPSEQLSTAHASTHTPEKKTARQNGKAARRS